MSIPTLAFYAFEFIAALSAIALIFIRNVFYGALLLIACLLALAALYVLAFAEFIAVTQILVYVGGILVIIIFGIMLTAKISGKPLVVEHQYILSGAMAGVSFFVVLVYFLHEESFLFERVNQQASIASVSSVGTALMTDFVLPLEVAGILLLIALVGAAVTASAVHSKSR